MRHRYPFCWSRTTLLSAGRAICVLALLLGVQAAIADGRIYASDFTPEIPDQRALIFFDGERQVMMIENHLALPDGRPTTSLGWVVPVPNVPEIAVADPPSVNLIYYGLRQATDPQTLPVVPFVLALLPIAFLYGRSLSRQDHSDARPLEISAWIGGIGSVLALVSLPAQMPTGPGSGVEVLKALQAGPLDAVVLRASSGAELVDWLKSNGFAYGERDVAAVEDYLRRKWPFVAAKLTPRKGGAFEGASASPPLVLSFPTKEVVYPVVLTGAGGKPLDLVLYVFAANRVEPSAPIKTVFAGPRSHPVQRELGFGADHKEAAALFEAVNRSANYVTKLSGKLSPDQMRQDIRFASATIKGDFRDRIVGPMFQFWVGGAFLVGLLASILRIAGRGKLELSGFGWFLISMSICWLLAVPCLLGSAGRQYFRK